MEKYSLCKSKFNLFSPSFSLRSSPPLTPHQSLIKLLPIKQRARANQVQAGVGGKTVEKFVPFWGCFFPPCFVCKHTLSSPPLCLSPWKRVWSAFIFLKWVKAIFAGCFYQLKNSDLLPPPPPSWEKFDLWGGEGCLNGNFENQYLISDWKMFALGDEWKLAR